MNKEDFLRAECSLEQADVLRQHIGKSVMVQGQKCLIVNVAQSKSNNGLFNITVRKLDSEFNS